MTDDNKDKEKLIDNELKERLTEEWCTEVFDRAEEVDECNTQDWYSILIGWGLAKQLSPDQAWEFASYIRYEAELG